MDSMFPHVLACTVVCTVQKMDSSTVQYSTVRAVYSCTVQCAYCSTYCTVPEWPANEDSSIQQTTAAAYKQYGGRWFAMLHPESE